jgi:hypothetical protein
MRLNTEKTASTNGLASGGVWLADTFVGFWKFVARSNLCEPPPECQAARRCRQADEVAVEKRNVREFFILKK